jgi:PncC family amidohydrolase
MRLVEADLSRIFKTLFACSRISLIEFLREELYRSRPVYDMDKELIDAVQKIHEHFKKKRLTLSVAESCTGGLISHYITMIPGASIFFEGGVLSYSADTKKKILGISSETISNVGVISEETAKDMAVKIRDLTGTDFSLSTTGNLGPDVLEGKDKGLIYTAVCKKEGVYSKTMRLTGTREENKEKASFIALKFLIEISEA